MPKIYCNKYSINRLTNCCSADKRVILNLQWGKDKMYPNLYPDMYLYIQSIINF